MIPLLLFLLDNYNSQRNGAALVKERFHDFSPASVLLQELNKPTCLAQTRECLMFILKNYNAIDRIFVAVATYYIMHSAAMILILAYCAAKLTQNKNVKAKLFALIDKGAIMAEQ